MYSQLVLLLLLSDMSAAPAKVYVVIYSVYHHVHKLAVEVQKGLDSTGVSTKMFQGIDTLYIR